MVGSELYGAISASSPGLTNRLTDIGPDFELVEGIEGGLSTLSDNLGIDVPDGLLEFLLDASSLVGAALLILGALETERRFRDLDRTSKNKLQVVKALTLMSRFGVSTVLAGIGATGGATAGSLVPGPGNFVGSGVGAIGGAVAGRWVK